MPLSHICHLAYFYTKSEKPLKMAKYLRENNFVLTHFPFLGGMTSSRFNRPANKENTNGQ